MTKFLFPGEVVYFTMVVWAVTGIVCEERCMKPRVGKMGVNEVMEGSVSVRRVAV